MRIIESDIIKSKFPFFKVESSLHTLGFTRGAMWDWDYAAYDFPLATSKIKEYTYLRVYVEAVEGEIEQEECIVEIKDIFISQALYHHGLQMEEKVEEHFIQRALQLLEQWKNDLQLSGDFQVREATQEDVFKRKGSR